ncbi:unnamed protein product [Protopolystoma xenopodis]|uniref:Uncharacterized protein n=1 Tax=Protopolystoma xenopodis TaxID=117903 RepID=A0A3S5BWL8_9PLAT|nr:unnamed protein product [Protopolystoma xenopodis]
MLARRSLARDSTRASINKRRSTGLLSVTLTNSPTADQIVGMPNYLEVVHTSTERERESTSVLQNHEISHFITPRVCPFT